MRNVVITSGIYGYRPEGTGYVTPVRAGERLVLPDREAARLVSAGVAADIDALCEGEPEDGGGASAVVYSVEMKAEQLRGIMERVGIPVRAGMTKADMVALLDGHFSCPTELGEAPPTLGVEGPVT